jgi:hypothetical protein
VWPRPGDIFLVGRSASVQFAGDRGLRVRVVRVDRKPTYDGWAWLTVYVLGPDGDAVARRDIYVQVAGLRPAPAVPGEPRSKPNNAGPARRSAPSARTDRRG